MRNEEELAQAIEKANSYRDMLKLWAWKDLYMTIQEIRKSALEQAVFSNEIENVQVQRGKVKAIDEILGSIDFILEDTK